MTADVHEPGSARFPVKDVTNNNVTAPAASRIVEKLAGSMAPSRRATRHRTEFDANAMSARTVYKTVCIQ
jgi:hypothetical protein